MIELIIQMNKRWGSSLTFYFYPIWFQQGIAEAIYYGRSNIIAIENQDYYPLQDNSYIIQRMAR